MPDADPARPDRFPAHHVYTVTRERAGAWPSDGLERVRPATIEDVPLVQLMHEVEFPATYATARHLVQDPGRITLVVEGADNRALGYASGHVGDDGAGWIDFMTVHPDARGVGDGSRLLVAVVRAVLAGSDAPRVRLAVEARRAPAIAFYERHGFEREPVTRPGL